MTQVKVSVALPIAGKDPKQAARDFLACLSCVRTLDIIVTDATSEPVTVTLESAEINAAFAAGDLLAPRGFGTLAISLRALLDDMAEEISLDDLKHHPGLRRLFLVCEDLSDRVGRDAREWAKCQGEG